MKTENATLNPEPMTLSNEQLGTPISENLSKHLKTYTNSNDRANASIKTGVGSSTIRDVTYRNNNLTEDNSRAIIELINVAIARCEKVITDAKAAKEELKSTLKA